jgi:hypothetical protein
MKLTDIPCHTDFVCGSVNETCLVHRKCKQWEALWSVCTVELWVCGKHLWNLFSRINCFLGWCVCAKVSEFYPHHINNIYKLNVTYSGKRLWFWTVTWPGVDENWLCSVSVNVFLNKTLLIIPRCSVTCRYTHKMLGVVVWVHISMFSSVQCQTLLAVDQSFHFSCVK